MRHSIPTNTTNHVRGEGQVRVSVNGRKTVHALALARPLFAWQAPYVVMPEGRPRAAVTPWRRLLAACAGIVRDLLDAGSAPGGRKSVSKPARPRSRQRVARI